MKGDNIMLCQKCGKKNANIYYKQTVNGHTKEYALCEDCAEKLKQKGEFEIKMPSLFDSFDDHFPFDDFFGIGNLIGNKPQEIRTENKKCTLCGSTFDQLVERGKVGCAKCYEVFEDELKRTVESIHGKEKYVGRFPKKLRAKRSAEDKINELKKQLDSAVSKQEYEQAAVIRDEIRKLEENKGKEE